MGIPPQLFDQGGGNGLDAALFQDAPQQPAPSQAQQPNPAVQGLQQAQQQPIPGGPVKQGLGSVLLHIFRNVMVGGVPMAAYPGDLMQNAEQRTQAGIANTQAQTNLANAETANQTAAARSLNIQNRPILLTDPQTGGPSFDAAGNVRLGTLADQKEMNDMFKATGGYMTLPDGLAASIGAPELAGKPIPVNTFNSLMTNQSNKTVESEIARLSQIDIAKGQDPNQNPAIQSLIGIRRALQNYTPAMADNQYREIYAKQFKGQPLTPDEQAFKAAYEKQKTLTPMAQISVQSALTKGSNAALANVPPHLVAPATEAATKAGADYAQAQSVTQRLQEMMDAAKNGNVVAYKLIPQEGALQVTTSQGVHRINMAEIQNYGGGSLFQQMEGHFGGALEGKSIPDSVLNDMAEMQAIQQRGSQAKYNNTLKTINQYYGSNFQPVDIPASSSSATNSAGMVTMRAPNGQTKQVPSDQVEHYKSLGAQVVTQ